MAESVDFIPRVAPNFVTRLNDQNELNKDIRNNEIAWNITTGDYSIEIVNHQPVRYTTLYVPSTTEHNKLIQVYNTDKDMRGEADLRGIEVNFSDIIEQLLIQSDSSTPLIVLDVGGRAGLSWLRLANHFRKEINENKLLFVVTNMEDSSDVLFSRLDRGSSLLNGARDLVHFIHEDVTSLRDVFINGVPLKGNVGFAHEKLSVTAHSKIPEFHVPRIAELLKTDSVYYIEDAIVNTMLGNYDKTERLSGIELALSDIEKRFDLTWVRKPEEGNRRKEYIKGFLFKKGDVKLQVNVGKAKKSRL